MFISIDHVIYMENYISFFSNEALFHTVLLDRDAPNLPEQGAQIEVALLHE